MKLEVPFQNNFRLIFETVDITDGKSLASACVVLFLVAFFQEGKSTIMNHSTQILLSNHTDALKALSEDTP